MFTKYLFLIFCNAFFTLQAPASTFLQENPRAEMVAEVIAGSISDETTVDMNTTAFDKAHIDAMIHSIESANAGGTAAANYEAAMDADAAATALAKAQKDSLPDAEGWRPCGATVWASTVRVYMQLTDWDYGTKTEILTQIEIGAQSNVYVNTSLPMRTDFGYPGVEICAIVEYTFDRPTDKFRVRVDELQEFQVGLTKGYRFILDMISAREGFHWVPHGPSPQCRHLDGKWQKGYRAAVKWCAVDLGHICKCRGDERVCRDPTIDRDDVRGTPAYDHITVTQAISKGLSDATAIPIPST